MNFIKPPFTQQNMEARIARHGDLVPCHTAFIDAHTPGSDQKENFTIIGPGVSENPHQFVHIRDSVGFNIGAAGQPPHCRNSLHSHRTAEVFFVLSGRWRFFWGRWGDAGEVVLEAGDIFNIPTGIFRGFKNIGQDYGMLMAILGGDDAGGRVIWAPQVIEDAQAHGLILGDNGQLYDSKQGEALPEGVKPLPPLSEVELAVYPEPKTAEIVPRYVARYLDMMALSQQGPCPVIGPQALIKDRPGFTVDFLTQDSLSNEDYRLERHEVLLVMRGRWHLTWEGGETQLSPGDTCAIPPGLAYRLVPAPNREASLFRVINSDDPAGPTWTG